MINKFSQLILIVCICTTPLESIASEHVMTEEVVVTVKQFKAISVAVSEFKKRWDNYGEHKITLSRDGENYVVIFKDPNAPRYSLGTPPGMVSFEVELDANLKVIRAHFSR